MLPAPGTTDIIFNSSPTPAPAPQDPRCRVPAAFIANVLLPRAQHTRTFGGPLLKIMSCCALSPLRACHESLLAAGCPDPAPPPAAQCSRQSLRHPSRQPLTPLVRSVTRAETRPPRKRRPCCGLAPSASQGAALRGRAAYAASQCAASSPPDTAGSRRHRRRPRRPRRSPPLARLQAGSDHAGAQAGTPPGGHTARG